MKNLVFFILLSFVIGGCKKMKSDDLFSNYQLVAEFPLTSHGGDKLGKQDSMELFNAVFKGGACYSNGLYQGVFLETGCNIETPVIDPFMTNDFSISLEIKLDTLQHLEMPIILWSPSYRFQGIYLDAEDRFAIQSNGYLFDRSEVRAKVDTWYALVWQHQQDSTYLYLDGERIASTGEEIDFSNQSQSNQARRFVNYHGGVGKTFRGYWRNLRIHTR